MRGTVAKKLRRHVREGYKFLSVSPIYRMQPRLDGDDNKIGTIRLAQECQRALYQHMKRNYKKGVLQDA